MMDLPKMIDLLREDLANEMTHMLFYLKNASTLTGLHRQEIRELFMEEAASEMKHVQEFQDLIVGLGGSVDGVFEKPQDVLVLTDCLAAVKYAYTLETDVVARYTERIRQAQELGGSNGLYIEVFLEEQVLHSRADADNLKLLGA